MSITLTTNTGATGSATIWSSLEASTSGSQSAQRTNALVNGQASVAASGQSALSGSLSPVIASAQATLDSIVTNPSLNLSRVLTSPSFAALVSALEGNAGNGNGLSDNGAGSNAGGSGSASSAASVNSIGSTAENSSGATVENSAAATGSEGFFSKLLSELESVLQTPTGGSAADGLVSGMSGSTSQPGTRLAVA